VAPGAEVDELMKICHHQHHHHHHHHLLFAQSVTVTTDKTAKRQ